MIKLFSLILFSLFSTSVTNVAGSLEETTAQGGITASTTISGEVGPVTDRMLSHPPTSPVEWLGETTVDVGDLPHREDFTYTFHFRNVTEAPLLIDNVRESCGCTASDWQATPVLPGEEGSINVTYDAMNGGYFRKNVKVFFRGHRGGHKLSLEGFVEN